MKPAVIRTENLSRRFGDLTAVDHLSIEVAEGEIFGLVGPDGAGKTTTLRLLCGLLDPSEGGANVAGYDIATQADAVKDSIGYMAQRFGLYGDLSVNENMDFYADLFGVSRQERDEMLPRLLKMTRMAPFGNRRAAQLSGGMKQKLALMCTLLHRPKILFLDEPTNGVDPVSRRDFWAILYQLLTEGITIFVTTAYLDEAERCNRLGLLHKGRLIRCDVPQAIRTGIEERCYEVTSARLREAREILSANPAVSSVEPAGGSLHLFTKEPVEALRLSVPGAEFREIVPSLEDAFIALVRKEAA